MNPAPAGELSCIPNTPTRRGIVVKAAPGLRRDQPNLSVVPCGDNDLSIGIVSAAPPGANTVIVATTGVALAKTGARVPFGALLRTDAEGRVIPIPSNGGAPGGVLIHVVGQALGAADQADEFIAVRILGFALRV